ncbi:MAG: tetratricopeptide repeat protein [Acidobacteriota bacterium]
MPTPHVQDRSALDLSPTDPSATDAATTDELEDLGDYHLTLGNYGEALRAYQKSHEVKRLSGLMNLDDRVSAAFKIARLFLKLGRYQQARGRCDEGLALLDGSHPVRRARLLALSGLIESTGGFFGLAREKVSEGLGLLDGAPAGSRRWRIEGLLRRVEGNLEIGSGHAPAAIFAYRRSRDLWNRVVATGDATRDDRWQHSIALFNLASASAFAGDYDAALPLLDQAFEAKTELEDRWGLAHVHLTRARILRDRREAREAVREAAAGRVHAVGINDPKIIAQLETQLGFCHLDLDKLDRAEGFFERAQLSVQGIGHSPEMAMVSVGLAALCRRRGELETARRHLQNAEALAEHFGDAEIRFAYDVELGRLAAAAGRPGEAQRAFDGALAWSQEVGNGFRMMEVLSEVSGLSMH